MAAGQQKKRLQASTIVSCDLQDLQESCGKKKKNVVSPDKFLNIKAHISLEWDENQQKVVAKREQIGITWRMLDPFINSFGPRPNALADVFCIPRDIFGLEDLTGVLSFEVWETQLTDTEKSFLTQFLPKGADAEQVVQSLLKGENLHFGNPSLEWGASLCSGKLHPDAILRQEQHFAAHKKAYGLDLLKYQSDYLNDNMMENVQKLRETWMGHEGPERDIVEKMWREGYAEKSGTLATTSERPEVVASSRKEEKPQRLYVRSGDGVQYMSYIKITRKQHQLVKGIKQSNGIKSKCLSHILGDIKSLRVQPYEVYEEEERMKLHEHWLRVAKSDIPFAFTNWTERLLQRHRWRSFLEQELNDNNISVHEDEIGCLPDEQRDNGEADEALMDTQNCGDDEESAPHSSPSCLLQLIPSPSGHLEPMNTELEEGSQEIFKPEGASPVLSNFVGETNPTESLQRIPSLNCHHDLEPMNMEADEDMLETFIPEGGKTVVPKFVGEKNSTEVSEQRIFLQSAEESNLYSTNIQCHRGIPSLNGHHELDALDIKFGKTSHEIRKPDSVVPVSSQYAGNMNRTENAACLRSTQDAWLEVDLRDSYYNHNHGYTASSELSPGQPHFIREQPVHLIDLETKIIGQDAKENSLHEPSDDVRSGYYIDTGVSFSNPYKNEDRNDFFHPLVKRRGLVQSPGNDPKQVGLQFLGIQNVIEESGHHPGHLQEQQQRLLEHKQQMRDRDYHIHQVIQKNMYANGGRHPPSSQEVFPPIKVQHWAVDPTQESAALKAVLVGSEVFSENAAPVEHRAHGVWSSMGVSSSTQCLGNGRNADGSLYSLLSQSRSYNLMDTSEQCVGPRNVAGGGIASNSNIFHHTSTGTGHQVNYLSGNEASVTLKANNLYLPQQNSGMHDSIEKPFLRSWNL